MSVDFDLGPHARNAARIGVPRRLPARYDEWVLLDLTGPDWRIREAGRIMLFAVVPITFLLLLPGPLEIRIYTALFVLNLLFLLAGCARWFRELSAI